MAGHEKDLSEYVAQTSLEFARVEWIQSNLAVYRATL